VPSDMSYALNMGIKAHQIKGFPVPQALSLDSAPVLTAAKTARPGGASGAGAP